MNFYNYCKYCYNYKKNYKNIHIPSVHLTFLFGSMLSPWLLTTGELATAALYFWPCREDGLELWPECCELWPRERWTALSFATCRVSSDSSDEPL